MSKLDIEGLDGFQILKGLILINFHVEEHNSPTHPSKNKNVVVLLTQITQKCSHMQGNDMHMQLRHWSRCK